MLYPKSVFSFLCNDSEFHWMGTGTRPLILLKWHLTRRRSNRKENRNCMPAVFVFHAGMCFIIMLSMTNPFVLFITYCIWLLFRPPWNKETTAEELDTTEKQAFLIWRRDLARLDFWHLNIVFLHPHSTILVSLINIICHVSCSSYDYFVMVSYHITTCVYPDYLFLVLLLWIVTCIIFSTLISQYHLYFKVKLYFIQNINFDGTFI